MTFIERLFDSLETPGPNSKWMEENSAVVAKAYAEMQAEMAMPSARACAPAGLSQQAVSGEAASHYRGEAARG